MLLSGCLGDQMAAVLGQRCGPGEAKNTYGTGCFMLLNTGTTITPSANGLLTTMAYQLGPEAQPHYALEGRAAALLHTCATLVNGLSRHAVHC